MTSPITRIPILRTEIAEAEKAYMAHNGGTVENFDRMMTLKREMEELISPIGRSNVVQSGSEYNLSPAPPRELAIGDTGQITSLGEPARPDNSKIDVSEL